MSRIGNRIITVPEGVTVEVKENTVFVKGPKGELNTPVAKNINVEVKENTVLVTRNNEQITTKQLHGTTNANIANMINGVKDGYTKNLEIVCTYRRRWGAVCVTSRRKHYGSSQQCDTFYGYDI